jgi:probable phosphoglycerate mutase
LENRNKTLQTVGSAQAARADTAFFQQARLELGSSSTITQIAHRAQELKTKAGWSIKQQFDETLEDIVMEKELPIVYLARHGETAWTLSGQHTGLTDIPLTERGERTARRLGERLQGLAFVKVYTSPLLRAYRTCRLAGFGAVAEIDPDLLEWDYGEYEGRRGTEIRSERPDWNLFRDGCPGGERPDQVSARADRVVKRVRAVQGNVLLFTSGHFIRVLASRWLGLEPGANSRYFMLSTASLSALGYENELSRPVIRFWNDTRHVEIESAIALRASA